MFFSNMVKLRICRSRYREAGERKRFLTGAMDIQRDPHERTAFSEVLKKASILGCADLFEERFHVPASLYNSHTVCAGRLK